MAKVPVDGSVGLYVEPAWAPGAQNPFSELDTIRTLARLAFEHPVLLVELSIHVPHRLRIKGYAKESLEPLRSRIMAQLQPTPAAKEVVSLLHLVTVDYERALADPALLAGETRRTAKVRELFTSAFSEALVLRFLETGGKIASEIFRDAHFYLPGETKPSPKNVDFFWFAPISAEIYECKNDPKRLLERWQSREFPGNEPQWHRTKLALMLKVHEILTGASWRVRLAAVTLGPRERVFREIDLIGGKPDQLEVLCQEDLLRGWPS